MAVSNKKAMFSSDIQTIWSIMTDVEHGTWIFFDMGEGAFAIYAGIYLVIGIVSMFVSSRIRAKKHG